MFCDTCGSSEGVHEEHCRGCLDNHCDVCLWRRRPGEKGWCAHCVMCPASEDGSIEDTPTDRWTLALAREDTGFMSWATRLGWAWDTAEKEQYRCMVAEASGVRTPEGD